MTSSSGFLQLLTVQECLHFRDNYGEGGDDCKMQISRITKMPQVDEFLDGLIYVAVII